MALKVLTIGDSITFTDRDGSFFIEGHTDPHMTIAIDQEVRVFSIPKQTPKRGYVDLGTIEFRKLQKAGDK